MTEDNRRMDEFEQIFGEVDKDIPVPEDGTEDYNYADKIVESAEAEFKGILNAEKEREIEKVKLETKLKQLNSTLKKTKNVKNHKKADLNKKIAERRKELKTQISEVKDRLYELKLEGNGSDVNSSDLASATMGAASTSKK